MRGAEDWLDRPELGRPTGPCKRCSHCRRAKTADVEFDPNIAVVYISVCHRDIEPHGFAYFPKWFSHTMKYIFIILALLYVLSPYDLLPDIVAGWGWLDDAVVLGLLVRFLYLYRKRSQQAGGFRQQFDNAGSAGDESAGGRQRDAGSKNPKDPHDVLGVNPGASQQEIKNAYRRLVSKYHPDKVVHLGDEFQKLAEIRFKEIQQAYQELKKT